MNIGFLDIHKGMLKNPDGTFSRTPQYDTWNTNNDIQLKDYHESTPKMPEELLLTPYHPKPTRLKLGWTFNGRVERYIDTDDE